MSERLKLIVMTGTSFAGKSTLGRALEERIPNTDYISGTQVARKLQLPTNQRFLTPDERLQLVTAQNSRAIDSLERNRNVIHDSANLTRERRDRLRGLAREHQAEPILIFADTPWPEVLRRWEKNKTKPETERRSNPELSLLEQVRDAFEPPTPDEEHFVFKGGTDSIPAWIIRHATLLDVPLQKRLIITTGLPLNGKTHFAQKLAEETGGVHIEANHLGTELGMPMTGRVLTEDERQQVLARARQKIVEKLEENKIVVFDHVNQTPERRDMYREVAEAHGASYTTVYVTASQAERDRRLRRLHEAEKPDRSIPTQPVLDFLDSIYKVPTTEEGYTVFDSEADTVQNWSEKNQGLFFTI